MSRQLVNNSLPPRSISRIPIFLLQSLVFLLLACSFTSAKNVEIVLSAGQPMVDFVTSGGTTYSICLNQENQFSVLAIFSQLNIEVVAPSSYRFQWHSVKGVSSDDFHSNIQRYVYRMFGTDEEKASKVLTSSDFPQNFFRDIVSSCPSPFYSTDRSRCLMPFSPFGEACVQVRTDQSVQLMATARQDLNLRLPFSMIIGLLLLRLSNILSKSSLFQVSAHVFYIILILGSFLLMIFKFYFDIFNSPTKTVHCAPISYHAFWLYRQLLPSTLQEFSFS